MSNFTFFIENSRLLVWCRQQKAGVLKQLYFIKIETGWEEKNLRSYLPVKERGIQVDKVDERVERAETQTNPWKDRARE